MVAPLDSSIQTAEDQETQSADLKWATVVVREVVEKDRLEASVYGIEARQARRDLEQCKWDLVHLGTFVEEAFYGGRSKRIYIDKNSKNAVGFLGSAEMLSVQPKPVKFLLKGDKTEKFALKHGQLLLSRSGTIGNVNYVNSTLEKFFVSEHAIRISCREYSGYVYAFLKSKKGRVLVESNIFGAVISQIEPEHLSHIPIPNPSPILKQEIHNLIEESFKLRDESNELMDETQALLKETLQLPNIEELQERADQFDKTAGVLNYSVPSSELIDRLDGSYYVPIVKVIEQEIAKTAREIVKVGDSRVSQSVILPGRFKRVYVEEGYGVVFFGGKQIHELDPSNKKYLSVSQHKEKIMDDLEIHTNSILITRSGTIGKVAIVPEHWEGWIPNEHIIRVVPSSDEIAGYLCAWLSSDYAYPLITRYTYGAVVDEINDKQVAVISIPLLRDENTQKAINDKVLEANRKRTEAYELEQEALTVLDEKVIYAR
jgi:type I restriction enzyme S subunit